MNVILTTLLERTKYFLELLDDPNIDVIYNPVSPYIRLL